MNTRTKEALNKTYQQGRELAGKVYDKGSTVDIGKMFKFAIFAIIALVLFFTGKGLIQKVRVFFGLTTDENAPVLDTNGNAVQTASTLITGGAVGNGVEYSAVNQMAGGTDNSNKTGAYEKLSAIQKLVDSIYNALSGANIQFMGWGSQGSIVNRIAHLSLVDLKKACYHFDKKYKPTTGGGLYHMIWWELDSKSEYGPALARLEKHNLDY